MTGVELNDFSGIMSGFTSTDINMSRKTGDFADFLSNAGNTKDTDPIEELAARVDQNAKEIDSEMNSKPQSNNVSEKDTKTDSQSKETKGVTNTASNEKTVKPTEATDEDIEKISETVSTVLTYVADLLDVPLETVVDAATQLDMSADELLSESGINELVMNVCNLDSPMDIVTDEQLFDTVTKINEFADNVISNLGDEMNLSDEELNSMLAGLKVDGVENEIAFEDVKDLGNINQIREVNETNESALGISLPKIDDKSVKSDETENESSKGKGFESNQGLQGTFTQTTSGNVSFETVGQTEAPVYEPNAQEIFDQIGDYIKNLSTSETSEIEIGLHPEELGNLHIKVTNQDGVVTAKLIAENEAVKNVLESQLVTLKTSFEEQGIKVSSVEVSVESRSFDQGMNQNKETGSRNTSGKKTIVRRINLDEIDGTQELEEEEQIAVEMMKADGNSVDYKA